ncbi:ferric reductase-like transmembrane domain-containing protein, partial [Paracoccus sp. P2]
MQNIKLTFWALLALLTALWLLAEPTVFQPANFFALRGTMVQYTGIIAMAAMSVAMILALRPRWPERWFGGLDKMYRLHKWLGIAALVVSVV